MSGINKAILLVAASPLRPVLMRVDDTNAGNGGTGIGGGSTADPSSPAYFREAIGDRVLFLVDQSSISPEAQGISRSGALVDGQPGLCGDHRGPCG